MTAPAHPRRDPDAADADGRGRRRRYGPFRRQPPVHSPIQPRGLAAAALDAVGFGVDRGTAPGADPVRRGLRAPRAHGDPRAALRELLRRRYNAARVVLCGSGTDALRLAIRRAVRAAGREVVALPAYTCFAVATAAVGAGVGIRLYDVDPATLAPDPDDLERVLEAGARVVVVAPLYGIPVDWDAVEARLAAHGAVAIEDAAQGHGAAWRGTPLGGLGRLSVLSFGRGKGWTGAAGGALLLRTVPGDEGAAADVARTRAPDAALDGTPDAAPGRSPDAAVGGTPELPAAGAPAELRALVSAAAQWGLGRPSVYGLPARLPWLGLGETTYRPPSPPGGMPRAAASLLVRGRDAADREASARRANAHFFLDRLTGVDDLRPIRLDARAAPGFLRLPIRRAAEWAGPHRADRALRLGIAPGYPSTLAALPAVRARMPRHDAGWPGARALARELITVPTHSLLSAAERSELLTLLGSSSRRSGRASGARRSPEAAAGARPAPRPVDATGS